MGVDPVSMALMAASLVKGGMDFMQGQQQAKAASNTAAYNAAIIEQQRSIDRAKMEREQRSRTATATVKAAGTGATLESFSDVFESNSLQSLLDVAMLDYEANVRKSQTLYQGRVESKAAKTEGMSGLVSGIFDAGAVGYKSYTDNKNKAMK